MRPRRSTRRSGTSASWVLSRGWGVERSTAVCSAPAVPHAHHFLERLDRVTREQMEFALGLYRDHEAVRYVLDHANVPGGVDRVAIAIDDAREGPFVIVTVDGRFVTCLGKGMRHDWPVVPRGQVDALLAKVAEK